MKKVLNKVFVIVLAICSTQAYAGNTERTGQAGGSELLINPWARTAGWNGVNTSLVRGLESINQNIGGLAFTPKTEVIFSRTEWFRGADINISSFGLAQKVGSSGVLGVSVFAMNFGDIEITEEENSEGGVGTYSPQLLNFTIAYSRVFSKSIYGGLAARIISEGISNAKAQGVAFDAGIQYVTGEREQLKFGIALRNVGPGMIFTGDGIGFKAINAQGNQVTAEARVQSFDVPSMLNIGASYDIKLAENHTFTAAGNFTSNSFSQDLFGAGGEYSFKKMFMLRGGYNYENGSERMSRSLTGLMPFSFGATVAVPLNDKGSEFGIDYGFKPTYFANGVHTLGLRINL